MNDIFFLQVSEMILGPLFLILNFGYIISKVKQYLLRIRVDYSLANSVTQQEAQDTFMNPAVNLASLYASILKSTFTSVFFALILPSGPALALTTAFFNIYALQYHIFRTSSKSRPVSSEIAETALFILNMVPLTYGVSAVIFDQLLLGGRLTSSWIAFAIGIVFALFPPFMLIGNIFEHCCKKKDESAKPNEEIYYVTKRMQFDSEYDRENPVTKYEANQEFNQLRETAEIFWPIWTNPDTGELKDIFKDPSKYPEILKDPEIHKTPKRPIKGEKSAEWEEFEKKFLKEIQENWSEFLTDELEKSKKKAARREKTSKKHQEKKTAKDYLMAAQKLQKKSLLRAIQTRHELLMLTFDQHKLEEAFGSRLQKLHHKKTEEVSKADSKIEEIVKVEPTKEVEERNEGNNTEYTLKGNGNV